MSVSINGSSGLGGCGDREKKSSSSDELDDAERGLLPALTSPPASRDRARDLTNTNQFIITVNIEYEIFYQILSRNLAILSLITEENCIDFH